MSKRGLALLISASLALATVSGTAMAVPPSGGPSAGAGGGGFEAPPYDPANDYRLGVQALKDSNYKEADKRLTAVLRATPNDPTVLILSGMAKTGRSDLKGAQKAYERALKYDKNNIDAHRELGATFAKLGQAEKAQGELAALKGRIDACKDTCAESAKLKAAASALEGAIAAPKSSAELVRPGLMFADDRQGGAAYTQAVSLINQGRFQEALTSLTLAKEAFGPHPDILTYMGYSSRRLGEFDQAERYYTEALSVAPDHKAATEYYGELKVERGDMAGARKLLARLDALCVYGCSEAQELRLWVDAGHKPS
ncbi:hypothetical protein BH11PSE2_BH11PSE2_13220 [soil metagenome]